MGYSFVYNSFCKWSGSSYRRPTKRNWLQNIQRQYVCIKIIGQEIETESGIMKNNSHGEYVALTINKYEKVI